MTFPKPSCCAKEVPPSAGGGGLRAPAFLLVRAVWRRRANAMQPGCWPWEQRSCVWSMDAGAGAGQELSKRGSTRTVQEVPSRPRLFRGCFTCRLSFTNGMRGPGCAEPEGEGWQLGEKEDGDTCSNMAPPTSLPQPNTAGCTHRCRSPYLFLH